MSFTTNYAGANDLVPADIVFYDFVKVIIVNYYYTKPFPSK